jgi:hypothetical protein
MTLRYVPHLFSKKYFVEKKIGTVLLSVTNTLKSVIMSGASALYRRMKQTILVILSDAPTLYRRMKHTTALRYKTVFLRSVIGRLLRQCSLVRLLAMTMRHHEWCVSPDLSGKDETSYRSSVQENFAYLQDFLSLSK